MKLRELIDVAWGTEYQISVNNCYKGRYTNANNIPSKYLSYTVSSVEALSYELCVNLKPGEILWWK